MAYRELDIVFDDYPGPEEGAVFVEVEDSEGRSVRVGEWIDRPDGFVVLRLSVKDFEVE